MKTNQLLLSTTSGIFIIVLVLISFMDNNTNNRYIPRKDLQTSYSADLGMQYNLERKANPVTGKIEIEDVVAAKKKVEALVQNQSEKALNLTWTSLGPDNVGGRTRALLVDKFYWQVMYAGGVAGGLWYSDNYGLSWSKISDKYDNIAISSICQASNGDIYFGTGEFFASPAGSDLSSGSPGQGIWKKANGATDFTRLAATWSSTDINIQNTFSYINELVAHPTDAQKLFAATNKGLLYTADGGTTWNNALPSSTTGYNQPAQDVKISSDGSVVIACINKNAFVSTDGGSTFSKVSGTAPNLIPSIQVARLEFAIAPSDANYIYCAAVESSPEYGTLKNLYQSTDKGLTWTPLVTGSSDFFKPFTSGGVVGQGYYDNIIAVYPDNPEKILLGGIDLWKWSEGHSFEKISYWQEWAGSYYVHADQHNIVFHPDYVHNGTIFFSNDGGVFRSLDGGSSFYPLNKNYVTSQFYSIAFTNHGEVFGGTQDNGTQYINYKGNTPQYAIEIKGGDGGGCIASMLDPETFFASTYTGRVSRSNDPLGDNGMGYYVEFYSTYLLGEHPNIGNLNGNEPFVPQMDLHESWNDPLSHDSIEFEADTNYTIGDVLSLKSAIFDRPIYHTITSSDILNYSSDTIAPYETLYEEDILKVQDTYQAIFAVGLNGQLWVTRNPLNLSGPSDWYPIIDVNTNNVGKITSVAFSEDGDYLFAADNLGSVFRCSNILNARTAEDMDAVIDTLSIIKTQKIGTFSQVITDIAVDPSNPNNIVVTLGNFVDNDHVYFSTNAATTTSSSTSTNFSSIQGNLPSELPVYTSVVQWNDSRKVIIGTEYGIFTCEDVTATTPVWTNESGEIGNSPVYMIRQQAIPNYWAASNTGVSNHGVIYAASHGRGLFKCETLRGPVAVRDNTVLSSKSNVDKFNVYPNPVMESGNFEYSLDKAGNVTIDIYDLQGKIVFHDEFTNAAGDYNYKFNASEFEAGTYLINLKHSNKNSVAKFMIY